LTQRKPGEQRRIFITESKRSIRLDGMGGVVARAGLVGAIVLFGAAVLAGHVW